MTAHACAQERASDGGARKHTARAYVRARVVKQVFYIPEFNYFRAV